MPPLGRPIPFIPQSSVTSLTELFSTEGRKIHLSNRISCTFHRMLVTGGQRRYFRLYPLTTYTLWFSLRLGRRTRCWAAKKKKQSQVSTIDIKSRIFEEDTRFKDSNTQNDRVTEHCKKSQGNGWIWGKALSFPLLIYSNCKSVL